MQIINEIEICFVEIINEIQKSLARLNKEKNQLTNVSNEERHH